MPQPNPMKNPLKHLRASDARAVARLATQATTGIVNIAEGVHQSVWQTLGVKGGKASGQTGGITGLVYQSVRGVAGLVGNGLDTLLARLQPVFEAADRAAPETPGREAVLAALNGVLGDRLAETRSALATVMTLRYGGAALDWQALPPGLADQATGKLLVLIHGLCMNDLQWRTGPTGDHGTTLAQALGYTALYVRYNTGLHTSQNGAEFSNLLEQLVTHWPTPVEEITVVAHSMGGLVTRSAVHLATSLATSRATFHATSRALSQTLPQPAHQPTAPSGKPVEKKLHWPSLLKNIVFLGTPHHGALLERAGNWVDVILGSTRYSKPFARLAQLRSAGITDLRYGHVLEEDWQGHDRFRKKPDSRVHVPLPEGVACFTVAATTGVTATLAVNATDNANTDVNPAEGGSLADRLIGDGLVPLHSALGLHDDPRRSLRFAKNNQMVTRRTNHMQLLSSPAISQQMVAWLSPKACPS